MWFEDLSESRGRMPCPLQCWHTLERRLVSIYSWDRAFAIPWPSILSSPVTSVQRTYLTFELRKTKPCCTQTCGWEKWLQMAGWVWREHAKGGGVGMYQREVSTLILVCEFSHKVHTAAALPTEWQPSEWHVHSFSLNTYKGQSPRRESACSVKIC